MTAIALWLTINGTGILRGQEPDLHVVRIEEDWELVIDEPDVASNAPQVTTVLSPFADLGGYYVALELNYQSQPQYAPGGVHLQLWQGQQFVSTRKFPVDARLGTASETITWTQAVEATEGTLTFEITDGESQTWGAFGGEGYLKVTLPGYACNLDGYRPEVSTGNSGVGFAKNRVVSLTLKRVRATASTGVVVEDDTARVVFQREE